eukprot:GEMP01003158.1.p1 GENE.GEMP01003158.1~~GEMP01003158.1.p1  ORF type:complete len:1224 (+),score=375.71 GEMP01003158.1:39-3710(+)
MYTDDATVHIMYIQKLRVQEEPPGNWNCVIRWYAGDAAHDCSHEFTLKNGVNHVKYCVFLVTNGSACELALTLSFVEGSHIAVALELDLSSFSKTENFEKIDVDLLDQGGIFATAELHTACQKRWGMGEPDPYRGTKFIRPISADPQAWFLLQHVAPEAAQREERLAAELSDEAHATEQPGHTTPSIRTPTDISEDVGDEDDACLEDFADMTARNTDAARNDDEYADDDETIVVPERTKGGNEQLNQKMDGRGLNDEEEYQRHIGDRQAEEADRRRSMDGDAQRAEEEGKRRVDEEERLLAEKDKRRAEEDTRRMEETILQRAKEDKQRAEEDKRRVEEDARRMDEENLQRAKEDKRRAEENERRVEEDMRRMEEENPQRAEEGKRDAEEDTWRTEGDNLQRAKEDKQRMEEEERQGAEEEGKRIRAEHEQERVLIEEERRKFGRLQEERRVEAAEEERKIALVKEEMRAREVADDEEKQRQKEEEATENERTKLTLEAELRAQMEKEIREQVEREVREGQPRKESVASNMGERIVMRATGFSSSVTLLDPASSSSPTHQQLAHVHTHSLHSPTRSPNHEAAPIPWQSDSPTRILSSSLAAHLEGVDVLSPRDPLLHPSTSSTSKPQGDAETYSPRLLDTLSQTQYALHHAQVQVQVEYERLAAEKLRLEEETRRVEAARLALCTGEEPHHDAWWLPPSAWEERGSHGNMSRVTVGQVEYKSADAPGYFEKAWEELSMDPPDNCRRTSQLTGKPPIPADTPIDGMLVTRISPPKRPSQEQQQQQPVLSSNNVLEGGSELGDLDFGVGPEVVSQHAMAPVVTDFHRRFQDLRRQTCERKSYEMGLSVADARGWVVPLRASQALDERSERALTRLLSIRRQWTNGKPATSAITAIVETLDHCLGKIKEADSSLLDDCVRYPQAHMEDLRDLRQKFASLLPTTSRPSAGQLPLRESVEGASLTARHSGPKESSPAVPGNHPTIQGNGSQSAFFSASHSYTQTAHGRKTATRLAATGRLSVPSRSSTVLRTTIASSTTRRASGSDTVGAGAKTSKMRLSRESPETAHPLVDWIVDQIHDPLPIGVHERLVRHSPKKVSCFKFPGGHNVPPPISPDASPIMSPAPHISVAPGRITRGAVSSQFTRDQESSLDSSPRSADDNDKYLRILKKLERSPLFKKGFARSSSAMVPQIPVFSSANPRAKLTSTYDPQYAEVQRAIRRSHVGYHC